MVILSANDWVVFLVCLLFNTPAQGTTVGWVMLGPVFKWFPLCEFLLFDIP